MKVFDLQCAQGHAFEGWFSSDDDFRVQLDRDLVACPVCSDTEVVRMPSAPRLNLRGSGVARDAASSSPGEDAQAVATLPSKAMQAAWQKMVRHVLANTEDVGERFAEEARSIHYGEVAERGIRGQATLEQTESLLEDGIPVMPLVVPDSFKKTLQ